MRADDLRELLFLDLNLISCELPRQVHFCDELPLILWVDELGELSVLFLCYASFQSLLLVRWFRDPSRKALDCSGHHRCLFLSLFWLEPGVYPSRGVMIISVLGQPRIVIC